MTPFLPKLAEQIAAQTQTHASDKSGILPAQNIRALIDRRHILAADGLQKDQIQPASLDLRLGATAYHIPASFLPSRKYKIEEKLDTLQAEKIDISNGAVLKKGKVYLVPLMESLFLPRGTAGFANPKSSTGRIDVFTRVISNFGTEFDKIPAGYNGALYIEICPRSFPIIVRADSRLAQIRFSRSLDKRTKGADSDKKIRKLHEEIELVIGESDIPLDAGLGLSVDLVGDKQNGLIGYRAKQSATPIDIDKVQALNIDEFWEPLYTNSDKRLTLIPETFYILASQEAVTIPPSHAAEMEPISPHIGEFRVHYAGFFDPGFGANGTGSHAVLEVRSREVPFMLEHGQMIGRLMYKPLLDVPDLLYGDTDLESNYQGQGLRLSKHFKQAD